MQPLPMNHHSILSTLSSPTITLYHHLPPIYCFSISAPPPPPPPHTHTPLFLSHPLTKHMYVLLSPHSSLSNVPHHHSPLFFLLHYTSLSRPIISQLHTILPLPELSHPPPVLYNITSFLSFFFSSPSLPFCIPPLPLVSSFLTLSIIHHN